MPMWISSQAPSPTIVTPSTRWSSGSKSSFTKPSTSPMIWPRAVVAEARAPDLEGHAARVERFLALADGRDLGNRPHAVRQHARHGALVRRSNAWQTATRACSIDADASAGKADDVARRVDVRHRGPIVRVDLDEAAVVRASRRAPRGRAMSSCRRGRCSTSTQIGGDASCRHAA